MVNAFLTINIVPDKMEQVLKEIMEINGVKQAHMVYGIYDVITEVRANNAEELRGIILIIRKMQNVLIPNIQLVK